ncbi:MAG: twin-arginine translocase subunit TatC, partial [Myxococcaceae bacterium]
TMFQFLLQEEATAALSKRIDTAELREQEAVRFLRIGDAEKAGQVAKAASETFASAGEGAVHADIQLGEGLTELTARLAGLGRLVDAMGAGFAPGDRAIIGKVMDERMAAIDALEKGDYDVARVKLDDGAALLASVAPASALQLGNVWQLEKDLALGRARYASENWTKPMLSMKEQLSLVLMLELAFGVIFELPLIMAVLGLVGILKASFLLKYQRHALVFCLFVAALVTPTGDPINMSLMAGPMFLCFEIGALAVWMIEKRRNKNAATTDLAPLE